MPFSPTTARSSEDRDLPSADLVPAWFCVRSKTRREPLAASMLRKRLDLEVFCPMLDIQRVTPRGRVWFREAMFPGYFFARFDFEAHMRQVLYCHGVTGLVHFGERYAALPDAAIEALRREVPDDEPVKVREQPFHEGDQTKVLEGPFAGLLAVVTRPVPSRERVRVLIDFLGRQVEAELEERVLDHQRVHPLGCAATAG